MNSLNILFKKNLFTLIFLISFTGFSQILYESSKMSFYYPEAYNISETRLIQNVDVKLNANDNSHSIIITEAPKEGSASSLDELSLNVLERAFKNEMKLALDKANLTGKTYLSDLVRKNINDREFLSFVVTTEVDFTDYKAIQLVYIYVNKGKQINFIASSESGNYSSVLNYIIKNFQLK